MGTSWSGDPLGFQQVQELQAKKKKVDFNQEAPSDLSSLASQSKIQQQQCSKQLEGYAEALG
jgi:hypothetical protein